MLKTLRKAPGLIYDQFNRLVKNPNKKPDRNPLGAAPLLDNYRDYVADGLTPERLAALFKEADGGELSRQADLFDQILERDGHLQGEYSKRVNVIQDADFMLSPATEDPEDVKIYEDVKAWMDSITDFPDIQVTLQDAVGRGFSTFELPWDCSEGQVWLHKFEYLKQNRFRFTDKAGLITDIPLLITDDDPLGIDIPEWRVMLHRYGGKAGHATRSGVFRICSWDYVVKHYPVKDWLIISELFGIPLRLGRYDASATEDDILALEQAVISIGHDAAGVISKSTEIEFPVAGNLKVSSDLYERLIRFAEKDMSKAILGSTLTADVDGKGSYAAANTHNDVRHDLISADARAMATTIRNQVIRPYVGWNFGWNCRIPKYEGRFHKTDLTALSKHINTLADRMDIPEAWTREKFGIPEPKSGEKVLRSKIGQKITSLKSAGMHTASLPNRKETKDMELTDMILADLARKSDPAISGWVKNIKSSLDASGSLEEFRDSLLEAYSNMDTESLGVIMEQAMMVADLGGRFEVSEDG